jgi:hypothetical protein
MKLNEFQKGKEAMKSIMKTVYYFASVLMCLSMATVAEASQIFISQQPLSYKVSYGTVNTVFSLPFTVVQSNVSPTTVTLTAPSLVVAGTKNPPPQFTSIDYECACQIGGSGQLPAAQPMSNGQCILSSVQGSVCFMTLNITANGNPAGGGGSPIPDVKLNYSFQAGNPARRISTTTPITISFATGAASVNRTFTFYNNSPTDVFIVISGGATAAINPVDPVNHPTCCTGANSCYKGATCINSGTASCSGGTQCFWDNPAPTGGYFLGAGLSTQVTFPTFDNGILAVWSGGVTARVGCSTSNGQNNDCIIADCEGTSSGATGGACAPGKGFQAPASAAEFTLQGSNPLAQVACGPTACNTTPTVPTASVDTYDVTIINGVSVPISMAPTPGQTGAPNYNANTNPYLCGAPGGNVAVSSNHVRCSWEFTPPTLADYLSVQKPADAPAGCTSSGDTPTGGGDGCACTDSTSTPSTCSDAGSQCGINFDITQPSGKQVTQICGQPTLVGTGLSVYWTADQICGLDPTSPTAQSLFACGTTFNNGDMPTYAQMYGCSIGNIGKSCYTSPSSTCCGCQDWDAMSVSPIGVLPGTGSCGTGNNPTWNGVSITATNTNASGNVQPVLPWLKRGCPTAYVYPFDDKSSTFTCQIPYNSLTSNVNLANYDIRFLTPG